MTTPNEKLAESLSTLAALQEDGRRIFRSSELSRTTRERLNRHGFIAPVMKGWWMTADPGAPLGNTTTWYASFWEFCSRYCTSRFGPGWHLSPETSLLLHAECTEIPSQIVIYALKGTNNEIKLLFNTSLFDYALRTGPMTGAIMVRDGLRLFTPAAALTRVQPAFFLRYPVEAQVALAAVRDASELLVPLLEGDHTVVAGRLVGALRRVGRSDMAEEIATTMTQAGHRIRESDPFDAGQALATIQPRTTPIVARLSGLWEAMRGPVIACFPAQSTEPISLEAYLQSVGDIYVRDAYHSLSIEGYRVTPELIDRVQDGRWSPANNREDGGDRDALAARGYWLAFQEVRVAVERILKEPESAASIASNAHRSWYRALFQPAVSAGLLEAVDLAGYRTHPVYIKNSRHVPPRAESVSDAMSTLFDLLDQEPEASVRAVLGHWLLGYIHPFPDGNGRIARFLMNAMLSSGGLPWIVIQTSNRDAYMEALEQASVGGNIGPFAAFLGECARGRSTPESAFETVDLAAEQPGNVMNPNATSKSASRTGS